MKIGINATCYNDRPSGAKQRFLGLYSQIFQLMHDHEFVIFQPSDCDLKNWFGEGNIKYVNTPIPSEGRMLKFFKGKSFWKNALKNQDLDLFECFNIPTIPNPTGLTFQTIHDIRSLELGHSKFSRAFSKYVHNDSIKKVDRIITVSNYMKNQILDFFPTADVVKIYNGINVNDAVFSHDIDLNKRKNDLKLPNNFLLSVGHFEKRKNYGRLLDSIKLIKEKGIDLPLIIVGNDNGQKKYISDKLNNLGLESHVKLFSNLSDSDVKLMYKLCKAFVFPSTYEGFGIPILEAMANGKPYILSDIEVFKEITEGHGIYFNPHDTESIASSILKALDDDQLCNQLAQFGERRVKDFDFRNIAIDLRNVYLR